MSISPAMFARAATRPEHCTKDTCPASYSIYGYAPNLGANAFFVAIFAISCLTFCYQARLYRKWLGFSIAMILGTALESVGMFIIIIIIKPPHQLATNHISRLWLSPNALYRPLLRHRLQTKHRPPNLRPSLPNSRHLPPPQTPHPLPKPTPLTLKTIPLHAHLRLLRSSSHNPPRSRRRNLRRRSKRHGQETPRSRRQCHDRRSFQPSGHSGDICNTRRCVFLPHGRC